MLRVRKGEPKPPSPPRARYDRTDASPFCAKLFDNTTYQRYTPEDKYDATLNYYYLNGRMKQKGEPLEDVPEPTVLSEKDEIYRLLRELKPRPNCIRSYNYVQICDYLNDILQYYFENAKIVDENVFNRILNFIEFLDKNMNDGRCGWTGDLMDSNACKREINLSTLVRAFFEVLLLLIHTYKDATRSISFELSRLSSFFFFIGKRTLTIPLSIYEEYFEKINGIVGRKFFIIDCPEDTEEVRQLRPRYPCGRAFSEIDRGKLGIIYVLYNTKSMSDDTQDTFRVASKYFSPDYDLGEPASVPSVSEPASEPEKLGGKRRRTRRTKKYKTKRR